MTDYQQYFDEYNKAICLDNENETLREKREIILKRLRDKLPDIIPQQTKWVNFNQGGYAMGLGVKPIKSDYDIDVAIAFDITPEEFEDPTDVKNWVLQAVEGHTNDTKMKEPCVTVTYTAGYHVDLAIYSKTEYGSYYLARGKQNSNDENKGWELADPKGLLSHVSDAFSYDQMGRDQFRRIIRYLKRWKEQKFSSDGYSAPVGIGITIAACNWFTPVRTTTDSFSNKQKDDDLSALYKFVQTLVYHFQNQYSEGEYVERLSVELPVEPRTDIFAKMTNIQMGEFKEKLERLRDALDEAINEVDPVKGCKIIRNNLDDEFPVPTEESTGQTRSRSIFSSSSAA